MVKTGRAPPPGRPPSPSMRRRTKSPQHSQSVGKSSNRSAAETSPILTVSWFWQRRGKFKSMVKQLELEKQVVRHEQGAFIKQ